MKEELKQFQKENGNVIYSTKELIQALHVKTDCINRKLDKKLDKTTFWKVMGGLIVIGGLIINLVI